MKRILFAITFIFINVLSFSQNDHESWNRRLCSSMSYSKYDSTTLKMALDSGANIHCACLTTSSTFSLGKSLIPNKRLKWGKKYKTTYHDADPLVIAYEARQFEAIRHLLERGANPFYEVKGSHEPYGLIKNVMISRDYKSLFKLKNMEIDFSEMNSDLTLNLFNENTLDKLLFFEENEIDLMKVYPNNDDYYDSKKYLSSKGFSSIPYSDNEIKDLKFEREFKILDSLSSFGISFQETNLYNLPSSTIINKYLELGSSTSSINLYHFLNREEMFKKYNIAGAKSAKISLTWNQYFDLDENAKEWLYISDFNADSLYGSLNSNRLTILDIETLLQKELPIDKPLLIKEDSISLLMVVLEKDSNSNLIDKLLKQTTLVNRVDRTYSLDTNLVKYGRIINVTPLSYSILKNGPNLVKKLLTSGANPNQDIPYSKPPLILALDGKNEKIIEYLIESGASSSEKIYSTNAWKYFKKFYPQNEANYEQVKQLLKKGK